MEEQVIITVALASGLAIGLWASHWGRNKWGWFLIGTLFPIISAIALVVIGKSMEEKARDEIELERMKTRLRSKE